MRREHLVRDAEQRPQRVDAAERIDHALIEEVSPRGDAQRRRDQVGRQRFRAPQRRAERAEQILQHEAAGARTGVDCGQDEQRLEQDREVIPEAHHRRAADHLVEDLRHADGQRRRAAGARQDRRLADLLRRLRQHVGRDHEAPARDRLRHRFAASCRPRRPGCSSRSTRPAASPRRPSAPSSRRTIPSASRRSR